MSLNEPKLTFQPVTTDTWPDMQSLFGEKGAYGGCWCTYWRMKRTQFESLKSEERKEWMESFIESGNVPGVLAYLDGIPVGWCSFGKRYEYPLLENSRVLKRVDEKEVWSIVCFYIEKKHRRIGVMKSLLREAVSTAGSLGALIVEGYPIDPKTSPYPDPYAYTGLMSAFLSSGFVEVARRSDKRPVMRYYLNQNELQ